MALYGNHESRRTNYNCSLGKAQITIVRQKKIKIVREKRRKYFLGNTMRVRRKEANPLKFNLNDFVSLKFQQIHTGKYSPNNHNVSQHPYQKPQHLQQAKRLPK